MMVELMQEIMALFLQPLSPLTAVAPSSMPVNKHIWSNDWEPKPANSDTDKKPGGSNAHTQYYAMITFNKIVPQAYRCLPQVV